MTPDDLFSSLAVPLLDVVAWIAAAVAAAGALFFVALGVRKGLGFFFAMLSGRADDGGIRSSAGVYVSSAEMEVLVERTNRDAGAWADAAPPRARFATVEEYDRALDAHWAQFDRDHSV